MRTEYTKIENFTIVGIHENNKFKHFVVADSNGERLSARTFEKASDAIEYGYELMESKGLLK